MTIYLADSEEVQHSTS